MESEMEQALSRRERKKQETRQRLLESALALFRENGYDETTVEDITERTDVAKGTFFNYFPSKEALLSELTVWQFSQLRDALDVSLGAPESPLDRIKLLVRFLYEQTVSDWHLFQRAFATRLGKPPHPQHHARRRLSGLLSDLVREAQACGEIRADVEPELVSDLMFVAHFRRLSACLRDNGALPPSGESEQVIDLLVDGLAGPKWRKR
jgi:AcrR family transcriptional regulator